MKKNKSEFLRKQKGITLIALVITIIVLIILAAISLMMLSGQDGILNRAGNAKQIQGQATAEEAVKRAILALQIEEKGKNDNITPARIASQVNSDNSRTDVTAEGESFPTNIIFPKENAKVYVNLDLSIGKKDDSGSGGGSSGGDVIEGDIYPEEILESEIAPDDIFIKEVKNEVSNNTQVASENGIENLKLGTAKITGIKEQYLVGRIYMEGKAFYGINYEKITNKLVIPYQVEINGNMYIVEEVDISQNYVDGEDREAPIIPFPVIENIVYPNTVKKISINLGNIKYENDQTAMSYMVGNLVTKNIKLSENLEEIPNYFFCKCDEIQNITLPNSIIKIGNGAFYWCNHEEISIPSSVTSIGDDAFGNNYKLKTININKPKGSLDYSKWGLRDGVKINWNNGTEIVGE